MNWLFSIIYIYITYSAFKFAVEVWKKENKKFAGIFIGVLGFGVPILGYMMLWM